VKQSRQILRRPAPAAGQRPAVTGEAAPAHVVRIQEREPESESLATEGSENACSTPR
jgi:hypothetical protein